MNQKRRILPKLKHPWGISAWAVTAGVVEQLPRGRVDEPFDVPSHAGNMCLTPSAAVVGATLAIMAYNRLSADPSRSRARAVALGGAVLAGTIFNAWTETKLGQRLLPLPEIQIADLPPPSFTADPIDLAYGVVCAPAASLFVEPHVRPVPKSSDQGVVAPSSPVHNV